MSEWLAAVERIQTPQVALIALDWAARPRDEAPKRYQAALELGKALAPSAANPVAVGLQVAALVHDAGIIKDLNPPLGKHRDMTPLTLTPSALAGVEHLLDLGAPSPLLEPPTGAPVIRQTWRSRTPCTIEGPQIGEALDAIRATRWRINPFMLGALEHLYPAGKRSRLTPVERGALHRAGTVKGPFYLDGHFDWRGRFYQTGLDGLQWTSAPDLVRSLLEFDDWGYLDDAGVSCLALHLTSMWGNGVDKLTDTERGAWVNANEKRILACVDNLKPFAFWRKAKHPWRFLAACHAFRDALAENPVRLPCTFDVTCSGVGIYALLVRDARLARLVNLLPSPDGTVQDFYTEFGRACEPPRPRTKAKDYAKTAIYGAAEGWPETPTGRAFWATMGTDARALFDWLRARAAAGAMMTWTLPDGFTVAHDYRKVHASRTVAYVGRRRIKLERQTVGEEMHTDKCVAGIAANFIHSWDGAYLRAVVRIGTTLGVGGCWGLAHDAFTVHPQFASQLIGPMGACQQAVTEVFGPDRLAMLEWGDVPGKRGPLPGWELGHIVG